MDDAAPPYAIDPRRQAAVTPVLRDLIGAPADEVAVERARVAAEGAGGRLLARQGADGRWGGAAWNRGWTSTMHVLMLLRDLGLDPASAQVRGGAREQLAQVFAQAARDAGKDEGDVALDAERARRAPVTVAVIARIDMGHPMVPAHEQWMAVGGALANFLNAAHLMGYAGKMLSGRKARDPQVIAAFCGPGETLVGWVSLGTAARAPSARGRDGAKGVLTDWPGA